MKRTNEEYLLLVLSAFSAVAITPFALIRFFQNEWVLGVVDLFISCGLISIFWYVYKTRKITYPNIALAIFSSIAAIVSIYVKGASNVYWIYPVIVAAYYLLPPKWAVILTLSTVAVLIPTLYKGLDYVVFDSVLLTILMTGIFGFFFSRSVREQHQQLLGLATKDSLTGIGNRRALDDKLAEVVASQARNPSTISLILLDLDHFKAINDEYGHMVGDHILVRIAEIISGRIRVTDALFRFGGEEFVIVPLAIDLDKAKKLAEQLRILVENHALIPKKTITISLGVAEYRAGETSESWMNRADEALYQAKQNGRNQVCTAK